MIHCYKVAKPLAIPPVNYKLLSFKNLFRFLIGVFPFVVMEGVKIIMAPDDIYIIYVVN
jgi:hypothetical protein